MSLSRRGRQQFEAGRTLRTAWLVGRLEELGLRDSDALRMAVTLLETIAEPAWPPPASPRRR